MDNSSLMNRENKKRQLRRQIVPPRYQTEEESEQAIRNAHKKTVRKRLAVLAVVAVLLGGAAFGIIMTVIIPFTIIRSCGRRAWQRKIRKQQ